jgi:hypothetical protein
MNFHLIMLAPVVMVINRSNDKKKKANRGGGGIFEIFVANKSSKRLYTRKRRQRKPKPAPFFGHFAFFRKPEGNPEPESSFFHKKSTNFWKLWSGLNKGRAKVWAGGQVFPPVWISSFKEETEFGEVFLFLTTQTSTKIPMFFKPSPPSLLAIH